MTRQHARILTVAKELIVIWWAATVFLRRGLEEGDRFLPPSLVPLKLEIRTDYGLCRLSREWKGTLSRGLAFEAWVALSAR